MIFFGGSAIAGCAPTQAEAPQTPKPKIVTAQKAPVPVRRRAPRQQGRHKFWVSGAGITTW